MVDAEDIDWRDRPGKDSNWGWRHHNLYLIDCHMVRYLADRDAAYVGDRVARAGREDARSHAQVAGARTGRLGSGAL